MTVPRCRSGTRRWTGIGAVLVSTIVLFVFDVSAQNLIPPDGGGRQSCIPFEVPGSCSAGEWCEPQPGTCVAGFPAGECTPVTGVQSIGDACDQLSWGTSCSEGLVCYIGWCRLLCRQGAGVGEPGDTCSPVDRCLPLRGDECIGYCADWDVVFEDDFESGGSGSWSGSTTK